MKRKILLVVAIFSLILSLAACSNKDNDKNEQIKKTDDKNYDLPTFESIGDKHKLLYDFKNGFIGNKYKDKKIDQGGTVVYAYSDKLKYVYSSVYTLKDKVGVLPNLGSEPKEALTKYSKVKGIEKELKEKFPKSFVEEKGYKFIFADNSNKKLQSFLMSKGIDGNKEQENNGVKPGKFQRDYVDSGLGYPTKILRQEPYKSGLKDNNNINIDSKWWDKYSYGFEDKYKGDGNKTYKVTSNSDNTLVVTDPDNNIYRMTAKPHVSAEKQLEQYIKANDLKKVE